MVANQTMHITAQSALAHEFFQKADTLVGKFVSHFSNLEALHDAVRTELTSPHAVEPVPLFASLGGFEKYQVAHADHSGHFTPSHGGTNSGRGPTGRA